jgi:hypothetical protein
MNGVQAGGVPRPSTGNDSSVALRLPEAWLARAEALRDFLASKLGPGGELTRSDVLRAALARGLEALEAERAAVRKPTKGSKR